MTSPLTKLGLGSGQFGLDQQTAVRGRPRDAEARDILSIAARSGLGVLEVGRHAPATRDRRAGPLGRVRTCRKTAPRTLSCSGFDGPGG